MFSLPSHFNTTSTGSCIIMGISSERIVRFRLKKDSIGKPMAKRGNKNKELEKILVSDTYRK